MRAAVIQFPGSNCDRDMAVALCHVAGNGQVDIVWHKETSLPDGLDIVAIPGGFSFGDYLRCGAIAARSPIATAIRAFADKGGFVLGVCNGFQVLTETGLLPGVLMRNAGLKYICKPVSLTVQSTDSVFTSGYEPGQQVTFPIAHHDGNYNADADTVARLQGEGRVAFTYDDNPNGSVADIAGVFSENRRVLGMMPHPERMAEPAHGGVEGAVLFRSLLDGMATA